VLHLEDIGRQRRRTPWLVAYLSRSRSFIAGPSVSKADSVDVSYASRPDWRVAGCFSPRGEELLSWCFAAMIHCLKAGRCYVMLLDKERSELVVVRTSSKWGPTLGDRLPIDRGVAGWVIQHRQPFVSGCQGTRMSVEAVWKEEYDREPLLAVPILGEEDVHGVLMAFGKLRGGTFSEHDLVTAEMLADYLALCIEEGLL